MLITLGNIPFQYYFYRNQFYSHLSKTILLDLYKYQLFPRKVYFVDD